LSVRSRLNPENLKSNFHGFDLHRPIKGTKLLLRVIKAIIIIRDVLREVSGELGAFAL